MRKDSLYNKTYKIAPEFEDSGAMNIYKTYPFAQFPVTNKDSLLQKSNSSFYTEVNYDKYRKVGNKKPFTLEQTDGIFVLFISCFLLFAYLFKGGLSYLKENFRLILSPSKDFRSYKMDTSNDRQTSYFLMFQFIVLISIVLYNIFWTYSYWVFSPSMESPFTKIITFIFLILLFYVFKNYLYKFIGFTFDMKGEVFIWKRVNIVSLELLSILYFIPTLLLIYSEYWHIVSIIFMAIFFIASQLVLFFKVIIFFIAEKFNFLYLIAYLCSVEILPCVFLTIGLIYLYRIDVFSLI